MLPKRNFKRKQKREKGSNQKKYKLATWRKFRKAYMQSQDGSPVCELSLFCGDLVEKKGMHLDHIIPIEYDGAFLDPRNVMLLTPENHAIKSALELNRGCLVDYTVNENGDYIPVDKKDILRVLKPYYLIKREQGER